MERLGRIESSEVGRVVRDKHEIAFSSLPRDVPILPATLADNREVEVTGRRLANLSKVFQAVKLPDDVPSTSGPFILSRGSPLHLLRCRP